MQIAGSYLRAGEGIWREKGLAMWWVASGCHRQERGKGSEVGRGLVRSWNSQASVAGMEWTGGERLENEVGNPLWDSEAPGHTECKTLSQMQIASDCCTL